MRRAVFAAMALMLLSGCASRGPGHASADLPAWPFAGLGELRGLSLGVYQGLYFSGQILEIDPEGQNLYAEAGVPGVLSLVRLPAGTVSSMYELGQGSLIENIIFHPDGNQMFVLASTVQPENFGRVQLARALLKIDVGLPLVQSAIAMKPDGYSHGIAIDEREGALFSLDSAGEDLTGGATISRVDLLTDDLNLRRAVGNLPSGVRRRGLAMTERDRRLFALVARDEAPSDFDPPGTPLTEGSPVVLASIDTDSLTIVDRVSLPRGLQFIAVAPSPRGVVVAGISNRGTTLIEIDTQLMREVGWIDIPEVVTDIAVAGRRAVLPAPRGLYIVDLGLFSLSRYVPIDFQRPFEAALSPDGETACVMLEDPRWPGKPALGIVDLVSGGLERIVQ
jgi:hypothetical protein